MVLLIHFHFYECCMSPAWPCFFFSTFNPSSFGLVNFSLTLLLKLIQVNNHSCRLIALHTHPTGWALCDSEMAQQMDYIPVVGTSLQAMGQKCLIKACQNSCRVLGLRSPHWGAKIMSACTMSQAWQRIVRSLEVLRARRRGEITLFHARDVLVWFLESLMLLVCLEP